MRTLPYLAMAILALGIVSYGAPASHAQEEPPECGPDQVLDNNLCVDALDGENRVSANLELDTDQDTYADGNTITLTGKINVEDIDPVTVTIYGPQGNLVSVDQITPNIDGTFETTFVASGSLWSDGGEYVITANHGIDMITTTFTFGGSTGVIDTVPPEVDPDPPERETVQPQCGPGTEPDADGVCQLIKPLEPECEPGYEPDADGVCQLVEPPEPECEPGYEPDADGTCQPIVTTIECPAGFSQRGDVCVEDRGGCLIATAAYGSELAPQIQLLREVRDGTLYSTASGAAFMTGFNQLYYLFSPTIADWERESPAFKEVVRTAITPMISTLGIMSLADEGSESEVLGYGISVIALNLGMYVAAPVGAVFGIRRYLKSRN